jgi:uncharacterized protein (DUF302 family)
MINPRGVIVRPCQFRVDEAIDNLVVLLQQNGATIYVRINQQTELHHAGIEIPPLQFILFGNPHTGGPVMTANPIVALDLPLKIIAWQDRLRKNWIAYNDAHYLEKRYGLDPDKYPFLNLNGIVSAVLKT